MRNRPIAAIAALIAAGIGYGGGHACRGQERASPAAFRAGRPVAANADGALICEAEEFQPAGPGWQSLRWGENYYAATLANTFLSRKAFLGAAEQSAGSATIAADVPRAGRYLALVRYESVYRFQTKFRLQIEQAGQVRLDRVYGARENLKVWPFGEKLKSEVVWPWGAVENIVWEGHDAAVELASGPVAITLISEAQEEPAARRNVDVVVLTPAIEDVAARIENERYLPLDGLLTQEGDVYARLAVPAGGAFTTLDMPPMREHSPYWVHDRRWQPKQLSAQPGGGSDWQEVGSLFDSLNDGQWSVSAASPGPWHYRLELGLRDVAGLIRTIKVIESRTQTLELAIDADTRYSQRIRPAEDVLYELLSALKQDPFPGAPPAKTPIYAHTFDRRPDDPTYNAAIDEFSAMFGLAVTNAGAPPPPTPVYRYEDVRGKTAAELASLVSGWQATGEANKMAVISLGDEIGLAQPAADAHEAFRTWAQGQGLKPADVEPAAGEDWTEVQFQPDPAARESNPRTFYFSRRFQQEFGIAKQKELTDVLAAGLPQAGIGANFSPHHGHAYLPETSQWLTLFRRGGMTMPWSEDYIWQVPVGTQQMNFLCLDVFRAALQGRPAGRIHYYVMPHTPGNTPASWRRQFYGDLAHGMQIVNLFEFRPVQASYTENHSSDIAMYREIRKSFAELARFEDLIQQGRVRRGNAALWFSETGDIWDDSRDPFAAGKRTLYIAARHQQLALDVVTDDDAQAGDLASYELLLLADQHVARASSQRIADWVAAGGRLLATAGAGAFDEFHQPNDILQGLLGVAYEKLEAPEGGACRYEKQDLPWLPPMDVVLWDGGALQVFSTAARARLETATAEGRFSDGTPAISVRQVGQGLARWCGFLPGLTYFHAALPRRPVDRGATDAAASHFIPTAFDDGARRFMSLVAEGVQRPVECSEPLVESTLVEAPGGALIPLINWSGHPIHGLRVRCSLAGGKRAALAGGGRLEIAADEGAQVFTLDLDIADAIILR